MAAGIIVCVPYMPARNRNGRLSPGALLAVRTEEGGVPTTTLATVYADEALTTPLANPVAANSSGHFPQIWADGGTTEEPITYTVAVSAADGSTLGNPSVFTGVQPSLDADTAAAVLATAAAESAEDALNNLIDFVNGEPTLQATVTQEGGVPVPISTHLDLLLTDFAPLNGTIGTAAQNTAAFNAMKASAIANGNRGTLTFPEGEIPMNPIILPPGLKTCGKGDVETILNFGAATGDLITMSGSANTAFQGIGVVAPGATGGAVLKIDGVQTPRLREVAFYGGETQIEFTGATGGVDMKSINGFGYTTYGVHCVDDVQGLNWTGGNFNAQDADTGIGFKSSGFVSALRFSQVEILTGEQSADFDGVDGDTTGTGYSTIDQCYFDAGYKATRFKGCRLLAVTNSWFSGGRGAGSDFPLTGADGVDLDGNRAVVFVNTRFANCGKAGVLHRANNEGVDFIGCQFTDNGQTVTASAGISLATGSQRVKIIGGAANNTTYSGGSQAYGIVADDLDSSYIAGIDLSGNDTGPINLTNSASATDLNIDPIGAPSFRRIQSGVIKASATWNPPNAANGDLVSTFVTATGAAVGDVALASFSSITANGWIISANVNAADTVAVNLENKTGGTVDLASGTVKVTVIKQ